MEMEPWMVAAAKEEPRLLEAQNPDRFDYLKLDLKSLIADVDHRHITAPSSASAAPTQGSTSNKAKRKSAADDGGGGSSRGKRRRSDQGGGGGGAKSRMDMAIEWAEACLREIQQVKGSFFC